MDRSVICKMRFAVTILSAVIVPTWSACAGDEPIQQFYKDREPVFRKAYDEAMQAVETERLRKIQAKEMPLKPNEVAEGMSAIRDVLYNKVIIQMRCAEVGFRQMAAGAAPGAEACIEKGVAQLVKYSKLEEYVAALGPQAFIKCQIKSRDFENELRFPPYGFLRDPTGPKLFDYNILNTCIMAMIK